MATRSFTFLLLLRVVVAVAALPFTIYGLRALFYAPRGGGLLSFIAGSAALMIALLGWWFVARAHIPEARTHMAHVFLGASALGAIGFALGFFGPIAFMPRANQGPLLGIFITGPMGFTVGGILGALYSRFLSPATRNA